MEIYTTSLGSNQGDSFLWTSVSLALCWPAVQRLILSTEFVKKSEEILLTFIQNLILFIYYSLERLNEIIFFYRIE